MKNSLGLLLVTCLGLVSSIQPSSSTTTTTTPAKPTFGKDHFTADCTATGTATITVENGYTAVGTQTCNPTTLTTTGGKTNYTLPTECVGKNKAFIIRPTNSRIVVKGTVYSLSCIDDVKDNFVVSVEAVIHKVTEQTGTGIPEQGHVTHPVPETKMEILIKDPSSFAAANEFTDNKVRDAYLGQQLYLAVYHSSATQDLKSLIPLYCQAKSTGAYLPLWNLTDSSAMPTNKCAYETSVMSGSFVYNHNSDIYFAFVGMEAFQFNGEAGGTITFSCTVRICISEKPRSQCETDHAALTACGSAQPTVSAISSAGTTAAAPTSPARKRRDVMETDDSPVGRGSLHHVTATLRIRDDVMATGGGSSVLYTVSCLILALLAAIVT